MKNVIRLLTLTAIAATVALPAFAQNTPSQTPATTTQTPAATTAAAPNKDCVPIYERFVKDRKDNQQVAFEAGKEYLQKCSNEEAQYVNYVKKFVDSYEKGSRQIELGKSIEAKKYAEAYAVGKQIMADNPEDVRTAISLAYAGLLNATAGASSNASLNPEAMTYAKKAIDLLQAGKVADSWLPFTSKDDALGWMHFTLGTLTLKNSPSEAAMHFVKSAQTESSTKKDPTTYYYLATAYQVGDYKKLSDEYKACCAGKEETPESKARLENINQVVDRIIDSYARAISYIPATGKPELQQRKTEWMKELTDFYKYRNNNLETGLPELITGIQAKPLPQPAVINAVPAATTTATSTTTPATTTPATTTPTTTTPSSATSTSTSTTTTSPATTTPATTTRSTTTTTQSRTTSPSTTTTPTTTSPTSNGTKPKP